MKDAFVHPNSDVQSKNIGSGTRVWQYVVILPKASIGQDCNICCHTLIENNVVIGDRVTIKSGVQLWDGIQIAEDVFVGPNVTFCNDKYPKSRQQPNKYLSTTIGKGVSIGAGAVILPGLVIGERSMIGAGAVVTHDVPPGSIVCGNPAKIIGYVDEKAASVNSFGLQREKVASSSSIFRSVEFSLYKLSKFTDMRGSLTVGEFNRNIPFSVKRYFVIYNVPSSQVRGEHAHKECHQFLVCLRGKFSLFLDDGKRSETFLLDSPDIGAYIPPMVWGVQSKFSEDAVLLVFASHFYDENDYIRDFCKFKQEICKWKSS